MDIGLQRNTATILQTRQKALKNDEGTFQFFGAPRPSNRPHQAPGRLPTCENCRRSCHCRNDFLPSMILSEAKPGCVLLDRCAPYASCGFHLKSARAPAHTPSWCTKHSEYKFLTIWTFRPARETEMICSTSSSERPLAVRCTSFLPWISDQERKSDISNSKILNRDGANFGADHL